MKIRFSFALAAVTLVGAFSAQACPRNSGPSFAGAPVGQEMVVNGLPVQIQQVSSSESIDTLLSRLQKEWTEAGWLVKRIKLGHWQILSALSEECHATLQLTKGHRTEGLFAIGHPHKGKDRATVVRQSGIELPTGAHVVSALSALDGPRESTTIVLTSRRSSVSLRDHFVQVLQDGGYGDVRMGQVRPRGSLQGAHLVSGQRGNDVVQIIIFDSGGTTAIVNKGQAL
jgi:hypothetical protein